MTIKAKTCVQLGVHIYQKGEVAEYEGAVTQRIADNFTAADGTELKVAGAAKQSERGAAVATEVSAASDKDRIKRCCEVMKREGIMQALDGMNITYSPKSGTEYLAKLLLLNKGEIAE